MSRPFETFTDAQLDDVLAEALAEHARRLKAQDASITTPAVVGGVLGTVLAALVWDHDAEPVLLAMRTLAGSQEFEEHAESIEAKRRASETRKIN